ncbi:hypothetical protein [Roseibium sp.]|uniref:hypothetical protein n=1 Tax=Roseibium sp. TaxID=1936156 RepID=UPI003BB16C8D
MKLGLLAVAAGKALSEDHANLASHAVMSEAVTRLADMSLPLQGELLVRAIDTANLIGRGQDIDQLLRHAEAFLEDEEQTFESASLLLRLGRRKWRLGDGDSALSVLKRAESIFEALGVERDAAICRGGVADILAARGEPDEALRILREEQLPVYERLGDVRSHAVTMGKIADILAARGEPDEALRILREEQLPVLERLGDAREKSIALYKFAGLKIATGALERGEVQEIYDALAEAFEIAISLKIPDGIGSTGFLLGQVIVLGGHYDDAIKVLEAAIAAFEVLGDDTRSEAAADFLDQIKERQS